jgi:hypothetical protein
MPTNQEYERAIKKYQTHEELEEFWQLIESNQVQQGFWEQSKSFEYLVIRAFELEGAEVKYPFSVYVDGTEVEQIDGVIYYQHIACIVETKKWNAKVNIETFAKLRNQLLRRPSGTTL